MSSTGSRSARAGRSRPRKADSGAATSEHRRSSAYRAETREAAAMAYHADALVMARMGYVPESEAWSTELEQVLVVGYVHAPERTTAVLEALTQAAADLRAHPGRALQAPPSPPSWRAGASEALEAKLVAFALGGAAAGAAICLVLAWVDGESPNALILGVFAVLGLVIGSIAGFDGE